VLVSATGFDTLTPLAGVHIEGPTGVTLAQRWSQGPDAYHGTAVDGFPNFWLLLGPNTGTGHTSVLIPIEAQAGYVASMS
jgi:cation diffusion facilitator CzcD-associated flavoprotein CzcO